MKKAILAAACALLLSAMAYAQPRPPEKAQTLSPDVQWEARYEGGIFGASNKERGIIKVDDENERVVFYRKSEGKSDPEEMFTIPYQALIVLYPDSKEDVPQSGKVISKLPLPGAGLATLMSHSTKYANMQFDDADLEIKGTASFRFDDPKQLQSFLHSLGPRAKMVQRGDAYYRGKQKSIF
jgi:hypothetical protein